MPTAFITGLSLTPFITKPLFAKVSSRTFRLQLTKTTDHSRCRIRMSSPTDPEDKPQSGFEFIFGLNTPEQKEAKKKGTPEPKQTLWGLAVFGLIFGIFALGLAATLARQFVSGGLTGPAQMM